MTCEIKRYREFNFVLMCAHREPNNKSIEKIKNAYTPSLDWDLACDIALKQRVFTFFYKNIKAIIPEKVPYEIMNRLKTIFFKNAVKNTYFCTVLLNVITLLKKNNIFVVPFKGPVLSQDIYGSIEFRQFADIDILVSIKDAIKSWKILIKKGFEPILDLNNGQKQKYTKIEDHIVFLKGNLCLELHWEITGIYLTRPIRIENIVPGLNQILIHKQDVNTLSPEILLIYLCVHGTKHGWDKLEQICCIDRILRTKNIAWDQIETVASSWKCKRMVVLGFYLAQLLLETPLPEHVLHKIKMDVKIVELGQMVISSLLNNHAARDAGDITNRFSSFHIRVRDSFADKVRYLFSV